MGFYSPNVLGSIMECTLCVSVCLVSKLKEQNEMNLLMRIIIGLGDIFIFSIILITGSRSAIIGLFVFLLLCCLFSIENKLHISQGQLLIIKIVVMFGVVFLLFTSYFQQFWLYYLHSGRYKAYENLKFLNTLRRQLFGIGLPEQDMSIFYIDGMRGNILDNYYIYTLVSTGVIGTILICFSIIKIGTAIYKLMKTNSYIYVFLRAL